MEEFRLGHSDWPCALPVARRALICALVISVALHMAIALVAAQLWPPPVLAPGPEPAPVHLSVTLRAAAIADDARSENPLTVAPEPMKTKKVTDSSASEAAKRAEDGTSVPRRIDIRAALDRAIAESAAEFEGQHESKRTSPEYDHLFNPAMRAKLSDLRRKSADARPETLSSHTLSGGAGEFVDLGNGRCFEVRADSGGEQTWWMTHCHRNDD